MSLPIGAYTIRESCLIERLEMAEFCIAALLVGLLASFAMRVVPFAALVVLAAVLRMGLGLVDGSSMRRTFVATILCVAIAQASYVIGLVAQSLAVAGSPDGRRTKLTTSLRRLMLQRK